MIAQILGSNSMMPVQFYREFEKLRVKVSNLTRGIPHLSDTMRFLPRVVLCIVAMGTLVSVALAFHGDGDEMPPENGGKFHGDFQPRFKCKFAKKAPLDGLWQLGHSNRLFVAPGNLFTTPIWYKYDSEESPPWSWTPFTLNSLTNPQDMWIPVSSDRVPTHTGVRNLLALTFLGQRPAQSNLKIIHYLNSEAPDPVQFCCDGENSTENKWQAIIEASMWSYHA